MIKASVNTWIVVVWTEAFQKFCFQADAISLAMPSLTVLLEEGVLYTHRTELQISPSGCLKLQVNPNKINLQSKPNRAQRLNASKQCLSFKPPNNEKDMNFLEQK